MPESAPPPPLPDPVRQRLDAASGYLDLGMPREATVELDALPPEYSDILEACGLRLAVMKERREWGLMLSMAEGVTRRYPEDFRCHVSLADATARCYGVAASVEVLRSAEEKFPHEGSIKLCLAHAALALEQKEAAVDHLRQLLARDLNYRAAVAADAILKPLLDELEQASDPRP